MPNWTKEQLEAINKDGSNILVSAGAGSGKTAVLTERVIRKLKEGINIDELLILTFTEAAAKSMKNKIRKAIKKQNMKDQLDLLDLAYITTFDSYCYSIVKKYSYLLGLNSNIKVVDSNVIEIKKEEILDDIFTKLYEQEDKKFYKLLNDFTNKNDKVVRSNMLDIYNKIITVPNYNNLLNNYFEEYYSEEFIKNKIEEFNKKLLDKLDLAKKLIEELERYDTSGYVDKINEFLYDLLNSKNYNEIVKNLDLGRFPTLRNASEEAKLYNEKIKEQIKEIKDICIYESENEIYESIASTKEYTSIIIDILKKLDIAINEYKINNNSFDFLDIELLAIKILKEHKEIAEEIKKSLNEIMIDEYQDTNDIQEELVSYIANNNVYMVGDIKQSIYRFRNANPYIFKEKYDNYSNNNGGIKIDLNKNFRSREEVLTGINKIFSSIMDDDIGGANYLETHQMIFGNNSYNEIGKTEQNNNLEIYNYEYDNESIFKKEEYEIFIIANDIKEKIKNKYIIFDKDELKFRKATYSDFVILIDKSKNFDLYKKIFEYEGIPLTILKDENLKEEMLLHLINNLITLTVKINENEYDDEYKHSIVSILRSFIFEKTDEEILNIYKNNLEDNFLTDELKTINIDSITSFDLINILINKFNVYEKLVKIGNIDSNLIVIDYLTSKALELSDIGYSIKDFNEYLKEAKEKDLDIKFNINKEDNNSVKIMTIHKSKGLEYSICYYPELHNTFNISELNNMILFDKKYGIITPYYKEGIMNTIYKYLLKEEIKKEEISEKLRLFYVSLTRAKEKMIMVTDLSQEVVNVKNDGIIDNILRLNYDSFNDIILSLKEDLKAYQKDITVTLTKDYEKTQELQINIKTNSEFIEVKELLKDNELLEEKHFSKDKVKLNTKEEIDNMKYGTYIHYLFEVSDLKGKNSNEVINNFLNLNILKNIENGRIYKEYEFIYEKEDEVLHGIIDLMIEYDNYIDIIDYKLSNTDDENYLKQLNGYKDYIENKFNKKTNIYLYSITKNKLIDLNEVLC